MNLADKLKKLAKARGFSRDEILVGVNALGVELSKSSLGNYFADINRPQLDTALALARVLGVSLDYLADDSLDDEPEKATGDLTPDERAVLSHYRVQARIEAEAGNPFPPEELAWRIAAPRYGLTNPTDADDAATAAAAKAKASGRAGG